MPRIAIVDDATGKVANVIVGPPGFTPLAGFTAVASETANIGDQYANGVVTPAPAPAPTAAELLAYAESHRDRVAARGVAVDLATEGQPPLVIHAATDVQGLIALNGAVSLAALAPAHVFDWAETSGPVQITAAQVRALGVAVGLYIQQTYTVLGALAAAIAAGTVTTRAQIETPPAPLPQWPANA